MRGQVNLVAFLARHAGNGRIVAALEAQGVTAETVRGVQALAKPGEATMALLAEQLAWAEIPFAREVRFAPPRKWMLDFWVESARLAVEVDGGVHVIRKRFQGDIEKHNAIERAGIHLLRFTPEQVRSKQAITQITAFLEERS